MLLPDYDCSCECEYEWAINPHRKCSRCGGLIPFGAGGVDELRDFMEWADSQKSETQREADERFLRHLLEQSVDSRQQTPHIYADAAE